MFDLVVLDLVFFNGLVCIFVFFCVSLDHFDFAILDYLINLVLLGRVFLQYQAKRLARKNVTEMTYFVSSGM